MLRAIFVYVVFQRVFIYMSINIDELFVYKEAPSMFMSINSLFFMGLPKTIFWLNTCVGMFNKQFGKNNQIKVY